MLDYYARVAPVLLPHLTGRPVTLIRYPNGVEGKHFYEKRCPDHRPDWVETAEVRAGERDGGKINFCLINDLPTLIWTRSTGGARAASRRLAKAEAIDRPTVLAFDLDPGAPATIVECCRVALIVRELFAGFGLDCFPKSSGSKGMQVYLPLNRELTYETHQALRESGRRGAREGAPRARRLANDQGAARGQGLRRLEPEHDFEDHRRRLFAASEDGTPDRFGAASLAGGGGGRRRRARGELVDLQRLRGARADR